MSDAWASFKQAFKAHQQRGRDEKFAQRKRDAKDAVAEVAVQADVRRDLGHGARAAALDQENTRLGLDRQVAKGRGSTTAGIDALGTVAADARQVRAAEVTKSAVEGMLKAIPKLLESIQSNIDQCDSDSTKQKLGTRLQALQDSFDDMDAQTPKPDLDKLEQSARALLNDAVKAGFSQDKFRKEMIPDQRSNAYKSMLQARYGFTIGTPSAPHLDMLYDALTLVPTEHIVHDSLTSVQVDGAGGALGDYSKMTKRIRVDAAVVKKHPTMQYQMEGTSKKVDTFKVTTLHEVGHSIDDRAGIMANPGSPPFGDWADHALDDVADAYWTELERAIGATHKAVILAEIKKALQGQTWAKPDGVPAPDWKRAETTLKTCEAIGKDEKPWRKPRPLGDRVYFKAGGTWSSYSMAARTALTVRDYQWRAPGEWFAELYAASWMLQKKPPAAVPAVAAMYMYRGK